MSILQEIRIPGNEIQVGDVMRFRMSKHDPIRWLKVIAVTPSDRRVAVSLEGGCSDLVSIRCKADWRRVRREVSR